MNFSLYDLVYLSTQLLGTYSFYKLISAFFSEKSTKSITCILSFILYNIIISTVHLAFNIPILTFAVNVICFFLLTFNYYGSVLKRILVTVITYVFLMCCELIVITLTGYVHFPIDAKNDYNSIFGIIVINIIYFALATIISNFKNIKKGNIIPKTYWVSIAIIPLSSLFILFTVLNNTDIAQYQIFINIVLILIINFTAFYLYDRISKYLNEERDKQLLTQQNAYYEKQLSLMESSLQATSTIRHDIKNHLLSVYSALESSNVLDAKEHISEMLSVCQNEKTYFNSGNSAIDSIISFKMQEATQLKIEIASDIVIPPYLSIKSFDVSVLLGNLLDNAIQAVNLLKEQRKITLSIKYSKGILTLKISNPYSGTIEKQNEQYLTSKTDKSLHGFGLNSIKRTVEKYDGITTISTDNNIFEVAILMYLEEDRG